MAYLLEDMACLACLRGESEHAIRLAGAAETLRQAIGAPRSAAEEHKLFGVLEQARQALGESKTTEKLEEGRKMNIETAVVYAVGHI